MIFSRRTMLQVKGKGHLDAGEGDGRGGVGSDHQGDEGGPQVSKHVGELMWGRRGKKSGSGSSIDKHVSHLSSFNPGGRQ